MWRFCRYVFNTPRTQRQINNVHLIYGGVAVERGSKESNDICTTCSACCDAQSGADGLPPDSAGHRIPRMCALALSLFRFVSSPTAGIAGPAPRATLALPTPLWSVPEAGYLVGIQPTRAVEHHCLGFAGFHNRWKLVLPGVRGVNP